MNADFDPEQPDAAHDQLLAALRQQLGAGFGQAPPPQTWAGIRRRLPPPRPWWRRPRLLLPALTLLLSLCTVVSLVVTRHHATTATRPVAAPAPVASHPLALPSVAATVTAASPATPASSPAPPASVAIPSAAARQLTTTAPASLPPTNEPATTSDRSISAAPALFPAGQSAAATTGRAALAAAATRSRPRHFAAPSPIPATGEEAAAMATHGAAGRAHMAATSRHETYLTLTATHRRAQRRAARASALATALPADAMQESRHFSGKGGAAAAVSATGLAARRSRHAARLPQLAAESAGVEVAARASRPAPAAAAELTPLAARSTEATLLTLRPVPLLLPTLAPPATLALRPDSSRPRPPFRGWAVQVLAGPTLSYRAVPTAASYQASNGPTSVAYIPSPTPGYASYERPALGWGAQVQARRVLDGRWAAALGLGYHQYATRLDVQIRQPGDSSGRAVQVRDTYNLLTVPLQFDYALAWPRPAGPLGVALLGGAELGWYRGGRTTEGSGCICQQQVFTGAADSPYNALSVAFSLGFDLRYRLGGPASRWQLLVQPTARYVATPFVQNGVVGYVRRQPYSLGLLAGLAWDWR